jgi:glutathione S-transferase
MVKLKHENIQTKEILEWKGIHLLNFSNSSCSQKLRIYLNLKNIDWKSHEVNLATGQNYSNWFLGINPNGLVPVLVDDGDVEIESNDILLYLEKKYPSPKLIHDIDTTKIEKELLEEDDLHVDIRNIAYRYMFNGLGKKSSKKLDNFEKHELKADSELIKQKNKEIDFYRNYGESGITDEAIKGSLTKFDQKYQKFNKQLEESKFLKGDEISILDIAWFIYTYRLYISGFPFKEKYPNVFRWYGSLFSRREFRKELNDNLLFKIIRYIGLIRASITGKTIKKLMN